MRRPKRRRWRRSGNAEDQANEGGGESRPRKRASDFDPDYSYVRKDLKRIAILAGFFLGVMVILSFILN